MAIMAGLPGSLVALIFLWLRDPTPQAKTQWTLTVLIVCLWLGFAMAVRDRVVFPLQTLSNLLSALREGDFSVRGRAGAFDDVDIAITWHPMPFAGVNDPPSARWAPAPRSCNWRLVSKASLNRPFR